ncbi:MAG: coproporphyrinogen dehydrogenase HemZ [Clostridia bacterium]|nr:coproporphyrinogen dehydrogenase HemZ [Clostridia bacterium]
MRLILDGKINKTYVQSLCMMFFHGEKFPENESNPNGILKLNTKDTNDGISCDCELIYNGKIAKSNTYVPFKENVTYERISKSVIGKAVYSVGKQLTGRDIEWGILTGIRPSKVAWEIYQCYGYDTALDILCNEYLLSKNKARLALDVALNENSILKKYTQNACSIYISIPFCPTRCAYCSFVSYSTKKLFDLIPEYINHLLYELEEKINVINRLDLKVVSLYIGGGTPTTLSAEQLDILLSNINNKIELWKLDEFTVECGRPDTITNDKIEVLKKYGVRRISVNPQTLNDQVLINIGRKHTTDDFLNAYDLVDKYNFEIINTDLIAGLDGDDEQSFKASIDKIIELNPENITVHSFSVKKSAQILRDDSSIYEKSGEVAKKSVEYSYDALTKNGYIPYYMYRQKNTIADLENVGYSKKDKLGIYNVLMMSDAHTVFGIGAGATTKLAKNNNGKTDILRIFSKKYPYEYLQNNKSDIGEIINFFHTEK